MASTSGAKRRRKFFTIPPPPEAEKTSALTRTPSIQEASVKPTGRLGNHLFFVAALLAHCRRHGLKPKIYINGRTEMKYYTTFMVKCLPFVCTERTAIHKYRPYFCYQPIPAQTRALAHTYFQSPKYFDDCVSHVIEMLSPPESLVLAVRGKHASLLSDPESTIAMHVRRGDYVLHRDLDILTPAFFQENEALVKAKLPIYSKTVVLSDDEAYCALTYKHAIVAHETNEMHALCLLSQFVNYVISNSTFSWWGVVLGSRARNVIAPMPWFGSSGFKDTQDVYCEDWTLRPSK